MSRETGIRNRSTPKARELHLDPVRDHLGGLGRDVRFFGVARPVRNSFLNLRENRRRLLKIGGLIGHTRRPLLPLALRRSLGAARRSSSDGAVWTGQLSAARRSKSSRHSNTRAMRRALLGLDPVHAALLGVLILRIQWTRRDRRNLRGCLVRKTRLVAWISRHQCILIHLIQDAVQVRSGSSPSARWRWDRQCGRREPAAPDRAAADR